MKPTTTYIHDRLQALYPMDEIRSFVRLILTAVCGLSYHQQILCKNTKIPEDKKKQIYAIVDRLVNMEPLQYVLGETEFYSIPLKVNPSVLIPRPETEELVDLILKSSILNLKDGWNPPPHRVLDIGTGSGCIAIALAKHIPYTTVTAIDISDDALQIASINALLNNVCVRFVQADILDTEKTATLFPEKFDLIASNPPYIMAHEKTSMSVNVLNYEPHLALFVSDEAPLLFYNAIADFAQQKLAPQGMLFFEINPLCATSIKDLLQKKGFAQTEIIRDLSGKNRFICTDGACPVSTLNS